MASVYLMLSISGCGPALPGQQQTGVQLDSEYELRLISMFDSDTGWAVSSENEILYTESGAGKFTVVRYLTGPGVEDFISIDAVSDKSVYVLYFTDSAKLVVDYTQDAGETWQQTLVEYGEYTDVGGAGSAYIGFEEEGSGYLLYCSTPAAGQMTKLLFHTPDAGKSFSYVGDLTGQITGYPQGIAYSGSRGYIATTYHGEDNYLYVSEDGGATWNSEKLIDLGDGYRYADGCVPVFYARDARKGMLVLNVVEEAGVYKLFTTSDGGENWKPEGDLELQSLADYAYVDEGRFIFLDAFGKLYEMDK